MTDEKIDPNAPFPALAELLPPERPKLSSEEHMRQCLRIAAHRATRRAAMTREEVWYGLASDAPDRPSQRAMAEEIAAELRAGGWFACVMTPEESGEGRFVLSINVPGGMAHPRRPCRDGASARPPLKVVRSEVP